MLDRPLLPGAAGWGQAAFVAAGILFYFGVNLGLNPGMDAVPSNSNLSYTVSQAVLLAGTVGLVLRHRWACLASLPALSPFLVLLLLAVFSILWSQSPAASFRRSASLGTLLAFALYAHAVLGTGQVCRIQVGAMWLAALASLAMAAAVPASGFDFGDYAGAIRGVFPQKNKLGEVMTAGVLALSYVVLARRRVVWTDGASVALSLGMTVLAQSTTALVLSGAIVGSTLVVLAMSRGAGWAGFCVLAVGGLGVGCALVAVLDPDLVLALLGKDPSLTGRTAIWAAVSRAAGGPTLLGSGYSAFWLPESRVTQTIWAELYWMAPSAHSGYLETILELGTLGLGVIIVLALLTLALAAWAVLSGAWVAGVWTLIVLAVMALYNADEASLPWPDIHQVQWVLAFLAVAQGAGAGRGVRA